MSVRSQKQQANLCCVIQVYELAFFAEEGPCVASLQDLKAQGFFRDTSDQTCCAALAAGNFKKMLVFHMLRSVTRSQFVDRLGEDLKPRLQQTGDEALLQPFIAYFNDKSFGSGTQFLMLWTGPALLLLFGSYHNHVLMSICMPNLR